MNDDATVRGTPVGPPTARGAAGTVEQIRSLVPSLVPSEARVARLVLRRPADVATWSIGDLAAAAEVSPTTVVRACQSLGFRGFRELRLLLARQSATAPADPAEAPVGDAAAVIAAVLRNTARHLMNTSAALRPATVTAAVDALTAAPRTLVAASGDLIGVAQHTAFRMAAIGRPVEAPADHLHQHISAAQLGEGDVCLALGHTGANRLTVEVARTARTAGATVITITSFGRSPMARLAQIDLVVGLPAPLVLAGTLGPSAERATTVSSRAGHVLMLDALVVAVGLRIGEGLEDTQQAIDAVTAQYVHKYDGTE